MLKLFKKHKKSTEAIVKDPTFIESQKAKIEGMLLAEEPGSEKYAALYKEYLSVQASEINEETKKGKEIENVNKSQEIDQKNKDRKASIKKTAITAGAGVAAAVAIPLVEQKVGPAMSKLSGPAMQAIFKQKS